MTNDLPVTLLIGNGLNQCLEGGLPWGDLLRQVAENFNVEYRSDIPMPLEFERLINVHLQNNPSDAADIYNRVKQDVADLVKTAEFPKDAIHHELAKLKFDSIITTNYDLFLEYIWDEKFESHIHKGVAGNSTKYLSKSVGRIGEIDFFHAHGCVAVPTTICLGYEHYMGTVQTIRSKINGGARSAGIKNIVAVLCGKQEAANTWMEKFYTTDVHIIGFGLYECEADFWWLLTHRASMYYANEGGQNLIRNTITYYDIFDDLPKITEEEIQAAAIKEKETNKKYALLAGMHVRIKQYRLSETKTKTYYEAYQKIINDIKRENKTI